jgi:molybdopterin-containing oxidoreductase family iron-sulfur binding subunit
MSNQPPKYWGSIEEYEQSPQFLENAGKEFVSPPAQTIFSEMERRDFLKMLGAGMMLATAACYRRPLEKIIPYVNRPEEVVPGVADWYTSTCGECSAACGILVKTREGRPIKLEGNPSHPMSQGGLCARGQASILNLYDPDRLKGPVSVAHSDASTKELVWHDIDEEIKKKLADIKQKNGKIYLLTGVVVSPSTQQLINEFLAQFPGATQVSYEGVVPEEVAMGQELAYGQKVTPRFRLDQAQVILTFGADLLSNYLSPVEFAKNFNKTRKLGEATMGRLVTVESALSLTGSNADVYFPVRPGDELAVALALANELVVVKKQSRYASDGAVTQALQLYAVDEVGKQTGINPDRLRDIARWLWDNKGKSLVVGGGLKGRESLALQVAVNLLNSILENDGVTVDYAVSPSNQAVSSYADLLKMIGEMKSGKVAALFVYKTNPAFSLPASLGFADGLKQVPLIVSFADRVDETAALADFVAPDGHYLEGWNDASPQKGLYSITQPAIQPLYQTRAFQDSLIQWGSLPSKNWYEYLKNQWQQKMVPQSGGKSADALWAETLQTGFFDTVGEKRNTSSSARSFNSGALVKSLEGHQPNGSDLSLSLYASLALYDGRSANNGWLQELPDPLSKITWENYLSIAPRLAQKMGLSEGDVVRVQGSTVEVELPIHIQPKLHEKSAMVAVGYGRTRAGRLGNKLGVNTFALQKTDGAWLEWTGRPISITPTGRNVKLASTQGFYNIEDKAAEKRGIIQEMTFEEFKKGGAPEGLPGEKKEGEGPLPSMWSGFEYNGPYRWGMAVDMNACIGCNACMIGCQSENNIPVVGKLQVSNGRAMHWIRIDRYYKGDPENPEVNFQPMLCQHCENAPCETVCPVLATVHNEEGLNMQVYNRCVGTRYCSNNCPYKVRRFNFFDYYKQYVEPMNLVLNPDLTVRSRGVMEKCTFCIQRIVEVKDKAKAHGTTVKDGELKTACQQSCPTDAITFGNTNDEKSHVSELRKSNRGYHVLEEINVKPQVTYLQKVRNV